MYPEEGKIGRINIVKTNNLPKTIYIVSAIPITLTGPLLEDILKFQKIVCRSIEGKGQTKQPWKKGVQYEVVPHLISNILQGQNSKNSMVLAQKQTCISKE